METHDVGKRFKPPGSLTVCTMVFAIRFVAVQLLAAFFVVQFLGLVVGSLFIAAGIQTVENPADVGNAVQLLGGILVMTGILLVVLYFYKGSALLKGLEALMMFTASGLFFSLFFNELVTLGLALVLLGIRFMYEPFRPFLLMFSAMVVGGLLGASLDVLPVLVFVTLISAYDFAAVFLTKHMVFLAERMSERKASMTVNFKHKKQQVMLGSGDFVVPLVLSVSLLHGFGVFVAAAAAIGAGLGLASLLWLMERKRGYYPGLPPIVFGELLLTALAFGVKMALRF